MKNDYQDEKDNIRLGRGMDMFTNLGRNLIGAQENEEILAERTPLNTAFSGYGDLLGSIM
jgi:hypothetical protein